VSSGQRLLAAVFVVTLPLVTPRIRASDEIEYFAYLPSVVFDHDLEFGNEYQYFYDRSPASLALFKGTFLDKREPETGRHINFGPIGTAVLWAPFYLGTHACVLLAGSLGVDVAADGVSEPYVASVCYASALYGFLGFLLIHSALRRFARVEDFTAGLAASALWLGTPALYYMTIAPGFSHAASLLVVSVLVWLWLRARDVGGGSARAWLAIGAVGGLAGLVREQDALFLAAPGLWLLLETVRRRKWLWGLRRAVALGFAAFVAFTPQLVVYKVLNGRFRPSRMVSGKLDYMSPHFVQVLFDTGHGLFVWTPLLLVAVVGLVLAIAKRRDGVAALLGLAFLLQVWINGSLYTWTQGGAFGSRRFVAATPVFAWGLAAIVAAIGPRLGRGAAATLLAVFVWWNVSLMAQFGLRLMDRQRLEWPRVAVNQFVEVPPRLTRAAWLFFTDRERLVREGV
jgi:Dolichyl-phosphate-mannose-protein mannosyltransferase